MHLNQNKTQNNVNQKLTSYKKKSKLNLYKKKIDLKKATPLTVNSSHNTSQFVKYRYLKPKSSAAKKFIIKKCLTSSGSIERNDMANNSQQIKAINTNNYIINTLNVSGKNFISANVQVNHQTINQNLNIENELNDLKQQKESLGNLYKKQDRLIEKLVQDNENLTDQITELEKLNSKLVKKINTYKENQEELIMLIKIIQKNGIDIEQIIDKWNNDLENEEEKEEKEDKESNTESLNSKSDKIGFVPIIDENKKQDKRIIVNNVPKLNFDKIKNNFVENKKNNSK